MKRKLLIGSGIVAVLLGTAVAAPAFIDWNQYKGQILTQLHNATGHDYEIGGPLALSILPLPHVSLTALSVKAPKEQGGATLLTLDKAEVSVELLPLLGGKVDIRSVTLEKPVFNAGIDKDGNPSWMTPKLKQQPQQNAPQAAANGKGGDSLASKVVLQSVRIHNGAIQFADARSGASYAAQNINITIKADTLFGPYAVEGDLDYNNAKIDIDLKTGTIAKGADSVAVQMKAGVPDAKGSVQFAGVAGLKAPYEIQGETKVEADNVAAFLKPFTKTPPAGFDKSLTVKGLLTYAGDSFALRNTRIAYAGNELNGDIAISGMKDRPQADVQISLTADKPVNLDVLMMQGKAAKASPSAPQSGTAAPAAAGGFLPKTLALPFVLGGKASVSLKTATYKGQTFQDAGIALALSAKSFAGNVQSALPGKGTATGSFTLSYANSVKNGSGVTLSDPSMIYRVQVKAPDPRALLGAFVPADKLKSADAALSSPLSADITGSVTSSTVSASAGSLDVAGMMLALAGSYTPKASSGRDAVKLTVSTDRLDADRWVKQAPASAAPDGAAPAPAQPAPPKADVAAAVRSFSLPFDLDLGATVKTLHYAGNDYDNVSAKGTLVGGNLKIADAGFEDQAGNVLHVSGVIADLNKLGGIDISVNGKTPDANLLLKTLKVDASAVPANAGAASAVAEFKGQADKLAFTANVNALRGSLEASGSLADLLAQPSLGDLTFRLKHPDYEALARLFSPKFRASVNVSKNLDLFTSMQRNGKVYSFKQIKATVGPATMDGDVTADMGGAVPSVTASLQFTTLPLDKLLGAEATSDSATTTIRPASASSKTSGGGHWSREPINTEWMRKWNADIKTSAGDVSYGNWKFTNAALNFTLKDGVLTLSKLDGGLYGGHINMTAKMAPVAGGTLDAGSAIKLENVSLESFVQSFAGSHLVKAQGTVNLETTLDAKGESPAALISALAGKGTMTGKDIDFQGFDLAQLSGVLAQPSSSVGKNFSNILGSATSGGSTHFDTLDGAYTVTAGVINLDKMKLNGPDASMDISGNVNLPIWTLDITSAISLTEPKDSPPPPLKISFKGPLDNPAQAFGKSALEGYFMQKYGSKIQGQIEKLDKNNVLGKTGLGAVLGGVLGQQPASGAGSTAIPAQPLNPSAATPDAQPETPAPAPEAQPPAAPAQPAQPADPFGSLLNNVIQQQMNKQH